MSKQPKAKAVLEPGDQLLLEQVRTFHRRSEAQTILDMLMAHPILTADEARELVRRRLHSLTNAEGALTIEIDDMSEAMPS